MPIKNLLYNYKIECIEIFLNRAFAISDEYSIIQQEFQTLSASQHEYYPKTFSDLEHRIDILLGYQNIVFRAVYMELNAIVELELKRLATSIQLKQNKKPTKLNRKNAFSIIENEYGLGIRNLPCFEKMDEIRKIANAYKHSDGVKSVCEEQTNDTTIKLGYCKKRYNLSFDKAKSSIEAVKDFMKALPGERQQIYE